MLRTTLRFATALGLGLTLAAAAAPPTPATAFGEAGRQVLVEAALVVVTQDDLVLLGLDSFKKGQRIDPATEASLATVVANATAANDAAVAAIQADPLVNTQDGASGLILLSIAGSENAQLTDLLAEDGEPKAGKLAKPARAARNLAIAAATALEGRPGRFPLGNSLDRAVEGYYGEVFDLVSFLADHGLPGPLGALVEVFRGGPKRKLVERAGLVPGDGMRARVKKNELVLSPAGNGPVTAGLDLNVLLGPSYAAYVTLKLPPKLSNKAQMALEGVSVGFKAASDASESPAEAYFIEHQLGEDGWLQSFAASKTDILQVFQHPNASTSRELVSFLVKDGSSLTVGALLRDENDETLVTHQIPAVGDLPVLGLFFRNNEKAKIMADNLIIFVTPSLIHESVPES